MTISIAAWNVNSVKARIVHMLDWLKQDAPDIALLQETKCVDDAFPKMEIEDLGYNLALFGEKTYNGVAILSKFPLEDIRRGLPGDSGDAQARYIEAVVSLPRVTGAGCRVSDKKGIPSVTPQALRVASVYVPNGQDAASEKFQYKLRFLDRLRAHMQTLLAYDEMLVIGGDYNIAPENADVHDPKAWEGSVLTHEEVRRRFRGILHLGMYDAGVVPGAGCRVSDKKAVSSPAPLYTWWDYRNNAFARDDGLRIDHLLLSSQAADALSGWRVEKKLRGLDKASDHAPVVIILRERSEAQDL
ncbi:MAG: exodeoxyribonuclease III [Pseudomonadota bacterium]|nr:exodeoxyribonuclease III [Pseudomonadota bacterium]